MSCDFELKMVVSYIERRLMYAEANRKQKVSKQRTLNSLQDGYLGNSKFLDFDPQKFQKQVFSGKSALKSKIFKIFKKPYYMYRKHMRVVRMPNFKFVSQFLTPNDCNKCEMWWRHKNKSHFWAIYRHRTQKQITPLDSWDETESERCVLFSKFWILKIDLFWPFLTWPWGQIWKLRLPLDSTSKITYITCVARLSFSFPHDDLMWPDRDLDLYLL